MWPQGSLLVPRRKRLSMLTLCLLFGRTLRDHFFDPTNNVDIVRSALKRAFMGCGGCGACGKAIALEVAAIALCPWSARMAPR